MVIGTGIDIVRNMRFELAYNRWGEKFLLKIFTKGEIACSFKKKNPFPSLSARFAGKEAFSKALGTGFSAHIRMKDIEITRETGKAPCVKLHGSTLEAAVNRGVREIHVSLSHESEYSVASVILSGVGSHSENSSVLTGEVP